MCISYKEMPNYSTFSLYAKNIPAKLIFWVIIPILTAFSLKYMFNTSENDFINSLHFSKYTLFITNIFSIMSYIIIPVLFTYVLGRTIDNNIIAPMYSVSAILGYIFCCILTMSCVVICLCLSNNLLTGFFMSYIIMLVPRIILHIIKQTIINRLPFLPDSELPFIFNDRINLLSIGFINDTSIQLNAKTYSQAGSIIYTGILSLIALLISLVVYKKCNAASQKNYINPFKNTTTKKTIKCFIYTILSLLMLFMFIILGTNYYCKKIQNNIPDNNEVNCVKLDLIGDCSSYSELSEFNNYALYNYPDYFIKNNKLYDKELIKIICNQYGNTVRNKNNFFTQESMNNLYEYCKVTFYTESGSFSRYVRFSYNIFNNSIMPNIFNEKNYSKLLSDMPDFSDVNTISCYELSDKISDSAAESIYNTYKAELTSLNNINPNEKIMLNTNLSPLSSETNIKLVYTFNGNSEYYIEIPINSYYPNTLNVFFENYLKECKDGILNTLAPVNSNSTTIFSLTQLASNKDNNISLSSTNITASAYDDLLKLSEIIETNLNSPDEKYSYFLLMTDYSDCIVPLDLTDNATIDILGRLVQ